MKSNLLKSFMIMMLLVAFLSGIIYFATRQNVTRDMILLIYQNQTIEVSIEDLSYEYVKGERINGKGEVKAVEGDGIKLSALLDTCQVKAFEEIKIEAQDAYQVRISYEEIQADKAYLLKQEDKGLRLIVFGDPNSKRSVSDVCKIMID